MHNTINSKSNSKSKAKAQVATEFLLYISLFILILMAAFVSIAFIQNAEIPARESSLVRETGSGFASAINLAARGGQGFEYKFTFSKSLLGKDYEIVFNDKSHRLEINWKSGQDKFTYTYPVVAYKYQFAGCLNTAENVKRLLSSECKNTLKFDNDGNTLTITQEN